MPTGRGISLRGSSDRPWPAHRGASTSAVATWSTTLRVNVSWGSAHDMRPIVMSLSDSRSRRPSLWRVGSETRAPDAVWKMQIGQ